jgi:hypothetical protein
MHIAVAEAAGGQQASAQAAANAVALLRHLVAEPGTRDSTSRAAATATVLLPILQHTTRPGTPPCVLLVQQELVLLQQQALAEGEGVVPPVPEGITQPSPPRGGTTAAAVGWYGIQQAILCALQVRCCWQRLRAGMAPCIV